MRRITWSLIIVILLSWSACLRPSNAAAGVAESTGPHSFALLVDVPGAGTTAWTNPFDAMACDDVHAEAALTEPYYDSHYLKATNAAYAVPAGASIAGFEINLQAQAVGPGPTYVFLYLTKKGARAGYVPHIVWLVPGTIDTTYKVGGSGDLWAETWTAADVNASDFGVMLLVDAYLPDTVRVNCLSGTVYYLPPRAYLPLLSKP